MEMVRKAMATSTSTSVKPLFFRLTVSTIAPALIN
jgi:hypothetical protein